MFKDFFGQYLDYTDNIEPPKIFQRWCAITSLGAYLGRQYYFQHGHDAIYPNLYSMLIGVSGTRKSTAIKLAKKLIVLAGYTTIAAEKSTKEKFLLDLAGEDNPTVDDILDKNLFGGDGIGKDAEMFIMADEFNEFFGNGNIEFASCLGQLWDYHGTYRNRIKNGKSVEISNPTISILGGNTPTNLSLAFPPEILGQGFFSRLLLIYGEPSGRRIDFPTTPTAESTEALVTYLRQIKSQVFGPAELTGNAKKLLSGIYQSNPRIDDVRFDSYSTRRFTQLIKLCLIVSANRLSRQITEPDVVYANTVLSYAEQFMPRALGEFGKAKNSDVSHKVLQVLLTSAGVVKLRTIWQHVHQDLEKMSQLQEILMNLAEAGKIQAVPQAGGFLPKRKVIDNNVNNFIDYSILTDEERAVKI
jgi:hypothetical protein